jgi:hypothetical protein
MIPKHGGVFGRSPRFNNVTVDGLLNANQIKFAASQVPSSDPNTLDDYEEGSWSPFINASTTTPTVSSYTEQNGTYIKIGRLVIVSCQIRATITNAGSGTPRITGLPFAVASALSGVSIGIQNLFSTYPNAHVPNGFLSGSFVSFETAAWMLNTNNYITFTAAYFSAN